MAKMMKGNFFTIFIVLVVAVGIGITLQGEAKAAGKSPIKIGWVAPYSGPFGVVGPMMDVAIYMALKDFGNSLYGHPVTLITKDDKNSPPTGVAVSRELIEKDKADIVIGPAMTGTAAATMATYTTAKVPQLLVGTAKAVIGPKYPYAFRVSYNTDQQADLLIPYLVKILGKKKVGVLAVDDALGTSQIEAVKSVLAGMGLKPTRVEKMRTGDTDVTGQINRIKSAGTDGIFIYASGPDAASAVRSMRDVGLDVPVVGHSGIATAGFLKLTKGIDISRVYPAGHCPMTKPLSPEVLRLAATVKEKVWKGGDFKQPLLLQGLNYGAVQVIREAIRLGGDKTDRASLIRGLKKIKNLDTMMGKVDYSQSNEGWPVDNIVPIKIDTWDPKTGTHNKAPQAVCGLPK